MQTAVVKSNQFNKVLQKNTLPNMCIYLQFRLGNLFRLRLFRLEVCTEKTLPLLEIYAK